MSNLRRWSLNNTSPHSLYLAADARLCQTSYVDDQSWQVALGSAKEDAALSLQTQYGGRVGLANLVPTWQHDNRSIYQNMTYYSTPTITHFAPNYMALEAQLLPDVPVIYEHLVLSSQAIGGVYTISNNTDASLNMRFELFAHVRRQGKEDPLATVAMVDGGYALSLSAIPDFGPILILEDSSPTPLSSYYANPRLGVDIGLAAGESRTLRWVHVGSNSVQRSISQGRQWLLADWEVFFDAVNDAAAAIPNIETGHEDWDLVLASSSQRIVQSVLRPAGNFPKPTFIAGRIPEYGFSPRGDGGDHPRMWEGQDAFLAHQVISMLATIHPEAAKGIIHNYLATQADDGFIDLKPGPAGQREDLLITPLLARMSLTIYERTEDLTFLRHIYPGLLQLFERWMQEDDDGDGAPEWHDDRQTGYTAFPTFAPAREWAQGADIQFAETPDLLGYLLSEAQALVKIAEAVDSREGHAQLDEAIVQLSDQLEQMWEGDHYAYRDRDTDTTTSGIVLLEKGRGDETHVIERGLVIPNRVLIRIIGGVNHIPNMKLYITGSNQAGETVTESANAKAFLWQNRQGVYTSRTVFTRVDSIRCEGLIRVYSVFARTVDTTALDINAVLPLWSGQVPDDHAEALVNLLLDETHFLRENGFTMVSAQDERFDPSNAEGAGGLWIAWQTLLGEALIATGRSDMVANLVRRLLKLLDSVLSQDHEFAQFYHADKPLALSEKGHLGGVAPVHLLLQVAGIEIFGPSLVRVQPEFAWGESITIEQHGVRVERDEAGVMIRFSNGEVVELDPDELTENQLIGADNIPAQQPYTQIIPPQRVLERVRIPLELDDEENIIPRPPKIIIEVEIED